MRKRQWALAGVIVAAIGALALTTIANVGGDGTYGFWGVILGAAALIGGGLILGPSGWMQQARQVQRMPGAALVWSVERGGTDILTTAEDGLTLLREDATVHLPWSSVATIEASERTVRVGLADGGTLTGQLVGRLGFVILSAAEHEQWVAQIAPVRGRSAEASPLGDAVLAAERGEFGPVQFTAESRGEASRSFSFVPEAEGALPVDVLVRDGVIRRLVLGDLLRIEDATSASAKTERQHELHRLLAASARRGCTVFVRDQLHWMTTESELIVPTDTIVQVWEPWGAAPALAPPAPAVVRTMYKVQRPTPSRIG